MIPSVSSSTSYHLPSVMRWRRITYSSLFSPLSSREFSKLQIPRKDACFHSFPDADQTGHNHFLYRYTVKKTESSECQCGTPHQTPVHLLLDCPNWTDLRHEILQQGGRQTRNISELLNDPSWDKRAADFMA